MDKNRILTKFDELNSYLEELESIKPLNFEEYCSSIKEKRSCERLLQISIEAVIDICNILVSELNLGLPSEEEEIFKKLEGKRIITKSLSAILSGMKGVRNILVHKYGTVKDEIIFEIVSEKLGDFEKFKEEIINFLKSSSKKPKN